MPTTKKNSVKKPAKNQAVKKKIGTATLKAAKKLTPPLDSTKLTKSQIFSIDSITSLNNHSEALVDLMDKLEDQIDSLLDKTCCLRESIETDISFAESEDITSRLPTVKKKLDNLAQQSARLDALYDEKSRAYDINALIDQRLRILRKDYNCNTCTCSH